MNLFTESVQALLGLGIEPKDLTSLQVSIRGIIVFVATLVMVRISSKRSLAEKTAFDAALIIIIASVLSRAINGSAPFVPTLVVGFVLVFLHRLLALGAYASHTIGILVKGKPVVIVENGRIDQRNMRANQITEHDLQEDMRLDAEIDDVNKIKVARVERSGDISFIKTQ
ncbi:MAG TPA: YetF domain-containing protein [Candidatus Udaeobacter sp.]|jgi:uncharacterized membrane protein YcaP (DUF421 family)|nr:YetF domain-containing protein [Candidatus Udaeobacter sp.]